MSEEGVTVINSSRSRSTSPTKKPEEERPRRFLNGWSKEQERLMEEWSDIAKCYRWLHDQSEKIFHSKTLWISLPVIILTTLGGTANFGIQSMFTSEDQRKYASFTIGSISLIAGLLTTVGNYLRYPQLEESHRVASITWGKFQRLIEVELSMNPNDRMDSMDFLKICRADLDRLIEQSPPIPIEAISSFEYRFGALPRLKKPDICGSLEHTQSFQSSETRLKQMAVDAALLLKHKTRTLNELLSPQVQNTIKKQVDKQLAEALEQNRKQIEDQLEEEKAETMRKQEELQRIIEERRKKIEEEIEMEKVRVKPITVVSPVRRSSYDNRSLYSKSPQKHPSNTKTPLSLKPTYVMIQPDLTQPESKEESERVVSNEIKTVQKTDSSVIIVQEQNTIIKTDLLSVEPLQNIIITDNR